MTRRYRSISSVLLAALLAAALPARGLEGAPPDLPGDPARGRDAFVRSGCIQCHAVRGAGGTIGPDLAVVLVGKGTVGVSAGMLNHFPKMLAASADRGELALPAIGTRELDDVVAYLFAVNFRDEPGSAERGQQLLGKRGCLDCHPLGNVAASTAPPLGRGVLRDGPLAVAATMWNHGARMWAAARARQIVWPKFEEGEFADVLAYLGGPIAPPSGRGSALAGDPAAGRTLFAAKGCARCHVGDEARPAAGPDLTQPGWHRTATEIAGEMWNHGPIMWERMQELGTTPAELTGLEMADVVSFVYLLRSEGEPGDAGRGATVFEERYCGRCHRPGGEGPEIFGRSDLDTPTHFVAVMWNHAPRMHRFLTSQGLAWPTFSETDVRDLVVYLRQPPSTQAPGE